MCELGNLTELVVRFVNASNDTDRSTYESRLVEWQSSPVVVPTCIESISSPGPATVFALTTLSGIIKRIYTEGKIAEFPTREIRQRCGASLSQNPGIPETCVRSIIGVMSLCALSDGSELVTTQSLSPEHLVLFLAFCLRNRIIPVPDQLIGHSIEVIGRCHPSVSWFELLGELSLYAELEMILPVLPKVERAVSSFTFEIGNSLMTFYEGVLDASAGEVNGKPNVLMCIRKVIEIMMKVCDVVFRQAGDDEGAIPYVCQVLSSTLSYCVESLYADGIAEIGESLFNEVYKYLVLFLRLCSDEFFALLQHVSDVLYLAPEYSPFEVEKWVCRILTTVIELITKSYDFCEPRMNDVITCLLDRPNMESVNAMFNVMAQNPPTGLYYVVGIARERCHREVVEVLMERLFATPIENVPVTALVFITANAKMAPNHDAGLIEIAFHWLKDEAALPFIGSVMKVLTIYYPKRFTVDARQIAVMTEIIGRSNGNIFASDFVVALLNVTPHLAEGLIGPSLSSLYSAISSVVSRISTTGSIESFVDFMTNMMKGYGLSQERHPAITAFCNAVFKNVQLALRNEWTNSNSIVQENLCRLVASGLTLRWIEDRIAVVDWILSMIVVCQITNYFDVIEALACDFPIPKLSQFLSSMSTMPRDLALAEINMLQSVSMNAPDAVHRALTVDDVMWPIVSGDRVLVPDGIEFFANVVVPCFPMDECKLMEVIRLTTASLVVTAEASRQYVAFILSVKDAYPFAAKRVVEYVFMLLSGMMTKSVDECIKLCALISLDHVDALTASEHLRRFLEDNI